MARTDGDGQGIDARAFYEFYSLLWVRKGGIAGVYVDRIFDAGQLAQLSFDDDAFIVGVFYDLLRQGDVFFEGVFGTVDHDRRETAIDASLADFKISTMVQMQGNGDVLGIL